MTGRHIQHQPRNITGRNVRMSEYKYHMVSPSIFKTFAQGEGRLIEVIQVILEDIKIYFERFLMRGICHGRQKQQ